MQPDEEARRQALTAAFATCLAKVPQPHRDIIVRWRSQGEALAVICRELGLPYQATRKEVLACEAEVAACVEQAGFPGGLI
jgi:hypothetical protein